MKYTLLLLFIWQFGHTQITKFEYTEEGSLTSIRNIEVYHNPQSNLTLIHFEKGFFGRNGVDYELYNHADTTFYQINSISKLAFKSNPKLTDTETKIEDFDIVKYNNDTLFVEQTVNEYNPFAIGDSVLVQHQAYLISNNMSNKFIYSIPYINAIIDDKIYIVHYKSTDQMDNSLTPYYSSRVLNSISIVEDFPNIEYDLVENYSDLIGNN